MSPDRKSLQNREKELVAEQPGLAVSIAGVLLAVFMGLAVRAALSSERIFELVQSAAAKADPRFQHRIGSAYISLADGIFPELAVVIHDVVVESDELCWMGPLLEVDELKLPVDLWHLVRGEIHVHEAVAGEVSLSLRNELAKCGAHSGASQFPATATEGGRSPAQKSSSAWDQLAQSQNSIDTIRINRLRVHYLPVLFSSFEIRSLEVNVRKAGNPELEATGILSLAGETLSGDYSSTAALRVELVSTPAQMWSLKVDGNWREGQYDLQAQYYPSDQDVQLTFGMNHIPLNQLLPLLRKYHMLNSDFNGRQTWLTARGRFVGPVDHPREPLQLDVVRLEGAIGEIEVQRLKFTSLRRFEFDPFDVDIKSLQLDGLMTFLNSSHPSPVLGKLGVFQGQMRVQDPQNIRLRGEASGLEVIFSNRGQRQAQTISLIDGEATWKQNKWNLRIDHVRPHEGIFLGDLNVEADGRWHRVAVRSHIDELGISPAVQKILTNGGGVGALAGDVSAVLVAGHLQDLSGHLNIADLDVEKIRMHKVRTAFSTQDQQVILDLKAQTLNFAEEGEPLQYIRLVSSNPIAATEYSSLSAVIKTRGLRDLSWDDLRLQGSSGLLRSSGGWNEQSVLHGTIQYLGKPRASFEIGGVRDRPELHKK